jgi:hypothetical protein
VIEHKEIALCGSMMFIKEIKEIAADLSQKGISSHFPMEQELDLMRSEIGERAFAIEKGDYIRIHLLKIENSNKVLVINLAKNGIDGYVGPNSLIELAFGYALGKKLYLLNEPGEQSCKPEILGMQPIILNGNIASV